MAGITHHIFGDEAGDPSSRPAFVLGFVKASKPALAEIALNSICERRGFSGEIKSSSTFIPTHEIRRDFIDYFASDPDLEFRSLFTRASSFDTTRYRRNHLGIDGKDLAYNFLYRYTNECKSSLRWSGTMLRHL